MLRTIPAVVAAALMAAGSVTSFAHADDNSVADPFAEPTAAADAPATDVEAKKPVISAEINTEKKTTDNASKVAIATRASQLQGMTIQNEAGKDLGNVRDIVIDIDRGRVKYVAVAYGGFLGLGSKLFAVPFEAFDHRPATQDKDAVLLLKLSEEMLRKAPGFDADNWPNMASPEFALAIDKHYADREGGVNVKVGPIDVDVNVDREPQRTNANQANSMVVHRADELIGMAVVNKANEKLGSINDLMVDMSSGDIRYAALSVGGLAGIGDTLHAVAWKNFRLKHNAQEDSNQLVLNANPKTLEKAKGFDQNNWPQRANPNFDGQANRVDDRRPVDDSRPAIDADIEALGVDINVNDDVPGSVIDAEVGVE
ncbi:PRC-barrel domain protein [Bremerella volcania]|uniref:PRC-barrel domain protein n=1 Tax=Bremerella volcania TaxID=2527984 RepID=A0A518CF77_9BACT|nr:PRC-barrel domain-containing protein [Bremerella volcania]QDU77882.1 PRC-barrel domain protein [Bremerella volcania]